MQELREMTPEARRAALARLTPAERVAAGYIEAAPVDAPLSPESEAERIAELREFLGMPPLT